MRARWPLTLLLGTASAHRLAPGTTYRLPAHVAAAVDFVSPTLHAPAPALRPKSSRGVPVLEPRVNNVPKTLRELYSIGDAVGKAPANKQAVTAFLEQVPRVQIPIREKKPRSHF